jgi:hypothetical protein
MRRAMVWVGVVAAAAGAGCTPCPTGAYPDQRITLGDGGLGDPCATTAQCGSGLACRAAFKDTAGNAEAETFRACTRDCAANPCPQGFGCADPQGSTVSDGGNVLSCVPTCGTDADCRTGLRAGSCVIQAGATIRICEPVICDGACSDGYVCQDSYTTASCYSGTSGLRAQPTYSWCGRQ